MYSYRWACSGLFGYRLRSIWSFSVSKRSQRFILIIGNEAICEPRLCTVTTASGSNSDYQPKTLANISGATIVASDSMMNFGVSIFSFPQVIFSLGTAPEYDPKLVVESLI
jgi:hypothetical protein